jgi:hypothetical protein
MPKPEIPRGFALVHLADLAALMAAAARQAAAAPDPAAPPQPPADAWSGLASAVAMLTARIGRHDVDLGQLADEADTAAIIAALVAMAAAGLRGCLDDGAEGFLQDLGVIAASRGRGPGGEPL